MSEYNFTLVLKGRLDLSDQLMADCFLFGLQFHVAVHARTTDLMFTREAATYEAAVESAIAEVRRVRIREELLRVEL